MLESVVEKYLKNKVKKLGGKCIKFISPGLRGVPDRLVLIPTGRIYFCELKQPEGSLRKQQELRAKELRNLGFKTRTLYSKEQVDEFIDYLITEDLINGI